MGIYVNPGNGAFQEAVNSRIYVDKTGLISYTNSVMNTKQKNLCVSRPRRFGKSMAADMLTAYYSRGCDSGGLFSGLEIGRSEGYEAHLNKHHVIRLDVQQFVFRDSHLPIFIDKMQEAVVRELRAAYKADLEGGAYGLAGALKELYACQGKKFIFIVDEWDCVFRIAKEHMDVQKAYLDFLRGLFKGAEYVELAYMTGILPIKKYGEHSAINIFDEYSMVDPKNLGTYFGFTGEEVQLQCGKQGVDFREVEKWYDGYRLGECHIYNPKSVVDALLWKKIKSYWTGTETYEALKAYIELNFDGLREAVAGMLGGIHCKIDPATFQNDMTSFKTRDDVLTLLVHLGYLSFDGEREEVFLPNQEVAGEFIRAVKTGGWEGLMQALNQSEEILKSTWRMDGEAVAGAVEAVHGKMASMLKYHDENSLTCTILMAYYSAQAYYMSPIMELPTGKGFADVVYLPRRNVERPALVIKLKWNKTAQGAVGQIKAKKYASWIEGYAGEILLVGINYDTKSKKHDCVIEKYRKAAETISGGGEDRL